ncbi:MAG: aggregation factor core [Pseudomonadota bacterium]
MKHLSALIVALAISTPALADLQVRFDEGAPKDRFTISNLGDCDVGATVVSIDLSGSPYGLIFDTTGSGAGVQVFQPFELTAGKDKLASIPVVKDGQNEITLDLLGLKPQETVSFTIDVDDTVNNREITVADAEIVGARVVAKNDQGTTEASFQQDATATLQSLGCAG